MKYRILALGLFLSSWAWAAPPTKPPGYNVTVHVTASRRVKHSESCYQYLEVMIDGRKYELESVLAVEGLLALGEYKARLSTDDHLSGEYDSRQVYEFQFPDKRTREFPVVGQME